MRLSDFNYELPKELIAQTPAVPRSSSKLMVVKGNSIEHRLFTDIVECIKPGDVVVINETKVMRAKLFGQKTTGGKVEVILTEKRGDAYICRIKGSNLKSGLKLVFGKLRAEVVRREADIFTIRFLQKDAEKLIKDMGELPTPPYIKKKLDSDSQYQTVYAKEEGSVAAPTAGLHFTPEILEEIRKKGAQIVRIYLHVSFGTFLPIRSDDPMKHKMEPEYYEISKEAADAINSRKGRLIAVGTTTVKALETAAKDGKVEAKSGQSTLFITPEHKFQAGIDAMITNFHLPKSTLILLVCGFAGKDTILNAYKIAIEKKYRFYSLGDAMLLFSR